MSYVVLARKWRPMKFEDVVDQKHVVVTLQNAIKNSRIANAYLFAGPRGVGKTTVARILAKAINCEKGSTPIPCNECASCIDITNGRSIDVFEIDGASNRGIDEVRNLRESLKYAPAQGKHKIYIIDEVHMLTDAAFNALLKTLEEPPSRVLFLFATTEPHKIPATILSRCQRFDFKRITTTEIISQLTEICSKEKVQIDDEAIHLIARKADGSMRDGQSLLDQAISFCGERITGKEISELLGIIDQEIYFKMTDVLLNKEKTGGLLLLNEIIFNGFDLHEFLIGLNDHFRNILISKTIQSVERLEVVEAHKEKYSELADKFEENDLLRLIKIVSDTEYLLKRSSNPRLTLELALMKMIKLDSTKELNEILDGIDKLQTQFSNPIPQTNVTSYDTHQESVKKKANISTIKDQQEGDNVTEKTAHKEQKETTSIHSIVTIEDVKAQWSHIISDLKKTKIALGSFLQEGVPTRIEAGALVISFGSGNGFHIKSIIRNQQIIENILHKFLGMNIKIKCIKDENIKTNDTELSINDSSISLADNIPFLNTIMEVFDGELVH